MKKCAVTNKESKIKYKLLFNLNKTPMTVRVYRIDDDVTDFFEYYSESLENENVDDFIKRVKKEVQTHEDL